MANAGRLVFALLVLFGGVTLAGTLDRLPPRVATHFDRAGIPLLGLLTVFVVGVGIWLAAFSALLRPPLAPGNRST